MLNSGKLVTHLLRIHAISAITEPQDEGVPLSLPTCNCSCKVAHGCYNGVVEKCSIHNVAPKILNRCKSLLEECNELSQRLKNLPSLITAQLHGDLKDDKTPSFNGLSGQYDPDGSPSLEEELSTASWIRHLGKPT